MPRRRFPRGVLSRVVVVGMLVGGAVCGVVLSRVALWSFHLKRFAVVEEGVLYRSAQPTQRGLKVLIDRFSVRTIACLRRENAPIRRNLLDIDEPSGADEDEAVTELGAQHLHWPMGGEAHWPWFSPEQFQSFFELMDDPANLPVAVHCIGGRHRTGTFVALYRMEYQGWSADEALREMHSFEFGPPVPVQEHNLRTYFPRPQPTADEWTAGVRAVGVRALACVTSGHESEQAKAWTPADYPALVRSLRQARSQPAVEQMLNDYVASGRPFALCLAARLIDAPSDPLAAPACRQAVSCLRRDDAASRDWAMAAALVADFGDPDQQAELLALLSNEPHDGPPSPRYQAIVRGVTNAYTDNRLAFLRPILDDVRPRIEPEAVHLLGDRLVPYRYCDTAVARLCAIVNRYGVLGPSVWDESRRHFLQWFAEHPKACRPCRLGERQPSLSREPAESVQDRDDYR